jgi:hypothetical protein
MATWKAKVTEVSALDAGAKLEAKFNIIRPNGTIAVIDSVPIVLSATGNPTNIQARIVTVATDYIRELIATALVVGQEISFEL